MEYELIGGNVHLLENTKTYSHILDIETSGRVLSIHSRVEVMGRPAIIEPNLEVSTSVLVSSIPISRRNDKVINNHHSLNILIELILVCDLRHAAKVSEPVRCKSFLISLVLFVLSSERLVISTEA